MRRSLIAVLALTMCLSGMACGAHPRRATMGTVEPDPPTKPPLYGLARVDAPTWAYDEYRLPQSCTPGAYDTRFLVAADSWANEGHGALALLDMDTGSSATVVDKPVKAGFILITSRCSNRWVAWEELRGDEQMRPWDVEWRLYAAPILEAGPSIGAVELVASSITSIRSRPLFQVVDDTLFWMTNSAPNPRQEGAVRGSKVEAYDLVAKTRRVLYESELNTHTTYVDRDRLVVSAYLDSSEPNEQVRVIECADGTETFRRDLGNDDADISHWPTYHQDYLVWGELGPTSTRPTLYITQGDGGRQQLAALSSDPVFVGDIMAFETTSSIDVANLRTKERFTLYRQAKMDDVLLYLLPAQPWRKSVLIAWGTRYGHPDDPAAGTIVRRYRVPQ